MEKKQFKIKDENGNQKSAMDVFEDRITAYGDKMVRPIVSIYEDIEKLAKLKVGDTIKVGMQFGVHEFFPNPNDKERAYRNTICAGWGVEVVEMSGF